MTFSDFDSKIKIIESWTQIKISLLLIIVLCLNRRGTPGWCHRTDRFICSVGTRARYRGYWRGGEPKHRRHRHGRREEHHLQTNGQQQRGREIRWWDQTWHTFLPYSGMFFVTTFLKCESEHILINSPRFLFFLLMLKCGTNLWLLPKMYLLKWTNTPQQTSSLVSICSSICFVFSSAPDCCVMSVNRPTDNGGNLSETFP